MGDSKHSDTSQAPVLSRRDAIIGALALAAGSLIAQRPATAIAADYDYVLVGGAYTSSKSTLIMRTFDGSLGPAYSSATLNADEGGWVHYGLYGQTFGGYPGGAGVFGRTDIASHYGVLARNTGGGVGLRVEGKASFTRSGKATVSKGKTYRTVTGLTGVGIDSMILATLQGSAGTGVYLRYAKRVNDTSFRVYLNKAATGTVTFAWFILG